MVLYRDLHWLDSLSFYHKTLLLVIRPDKEREIGATYWSSLHDMLPYCDFVMIICPLTPQTEKMFGDKEFILMKDSATLVNIARGE